MIECRTTTRTWYLVDGSRPVTRPLVVENAKYLGLDIDAFSETCTTYFFAVSTRFHARASDVPSDPVTRRLAGAGQRNVDPEITELHGLSASFVVECLTTMRTWYVVDGFNPVTRPLFVEKAKCIGLDIDAFSETCTTYFFAVDTWFHAKANDVA
ncbi:hypothetical protein GCM10009821_07190 [Aeromicrobium halocynthiae]|uniref:Uncharacterized protein n=1 Tax=Aeromicrobium halocynthiae TaxID=560557 RepID=A0ABN2VT64_9ACTN